MPNSNGAQTLEAADGQTAAAVDKEAPGLPSKENQGKHSKTRKRALLIAAAIVAAIAAGCYAWNAFRYEDTDDAQLFEAQTEAIGALARLLATDCGDWRSFLGEGSQ